MKNSPRIILGIETSCDETAVAIVTEDRKILSHQILSQNEHAAYGGVVPELAARSHLNHLDRLIEKALSESGQTLKDLDAIAATAGPGLIGGVWVGAITAKAIAAVHKMPLIAVNHLEGHALTVRLTEDVPFPYLLLLASGGHCQILIVKGVGDYRLLGQTIDDAAGEAFDKTAKLLGLGYPGGPAIEKLAQECADRTAAQKRFPLPTPLTGEAHCNFSFSGLKTAVRRSVESLPPTISRADAAALCCSFQESVVHVLNDRLERALTLYMNEKPAAPTLVVAGGVAANVRVRGALQDLAQSHGVRFTAPPLNLCTDNAAMIAWAGIERLRLNMIDPLDFPVRPRWPLDAQPGNVEA